MQHLSLPRLGQPPQLHAIIHYKSLQSDEFDTLNTHPSTQQTAREQSRSKIPSPTTIQPPKNHISFVDSPKNHPLTISDREKHNVATCNADLGMQQRKFKSHNNIEWVDQPQKNQSSKATRRNKIFQSGYFSKRANNHQQQNRPLKHHSSAKNFFNSSHYPFNHPLNLKESIMAKPEVGSGRFFESIPLVQNSRLVKVNSCSQMPKLSPVKSVSNKITFTYAQPQQKQHRPASIVTHPVVNRSTPIYTSIVHPVYTPLPQDNTRQINNNPATLKIKKPNPTQRKGTLIDQIKHYPPYSNSRSLAQERESPIVFDSRGSKISLGNNIKQSLIGGSLATDRLKLGESISNIEQDNTQRYFDQEEGEIFLAQRISYKNIDIPDEVEENVDLADAHMQNIFSDFEYSRHKEKQKERSEKERQKEIKIQIKPQAPQPKTITILEQSTLNIYDKTDATHKFINIPVLLIGLASLLLLIQMLS